MSRERPRILKVAASHFVNVTEVFNVIKKIEFQRERKLLLRLSKHFQKHDMKFCFKILVETGCLSRHE